MFKKKDGIENKWRPASSPFKALFHYAGKKEIMHRKLQKTRCDYTKERSKQREHLNTEIAGLNKLLSESSVDEDTHARLKKMLEMGYEQKRRETRQKYGFTENLDAIRAANEIKNKCYTPL